MYEATYILVFWLFIRTKHLPVTPAQLIRPCIGRNAHWMTFYCIVGLFFREMWFLIVHTHKALEQFLKLCIFALKNVTSCWLSSSITYLRAQYVKKDARLSPASKHVCAASNEKLGTEWDWNKVGFMPGLHAHVERTWVCGEECYVSRVHVVLDVISRDSAWVGLLCSHYW